MSVSSKEKKISVTYCKPKKKKHCNHVFIKSNHFDGKGGEMSKFNVLYKAKPLDHLIVVTIKTNNEINLMFPLP